VCDQGSLVGLCTVAYLGFWIGGKGGLSAEGAEGSETFFNFLNENGVFECFKVVPAAEGLAPDVRTPCLEIVRKKLGYET